MFKVMDDQIEGEIHPNQTVLRWGIMGAGTCQDVQSGLIGTDRDYSRRQSQQKRAADFKQQRFGYHRLWFLLKLASREDVDIVYIATNHPQHLACAKVAFTRGKHVLVEKPIAVNAAEGKEMVDLARKKTFFMEGMVSFTLSIKKVKMDSLGRIGEINMFEANAVCRDPENDLRLYNLGWAAALF